MSDNSTEHMTFDETQPRVNVELSAQHPRGRPEHQLVIVNQQDAEAAAVGGWLLVWRVGHRDPQARRDRR